MKNRYVTLHFFFVLLAFCGVAVSYVQAQEYVQLTDLPTLYIDTEGKQTITSKEDYISSTVRYVDGNGVTLYENVSIRGRGNSTWGLAKKPYRLKFASKEKFLGKDHANAKSWTLLANYADKTLIRNAVTSCIGDFAGQPFTASAQFVDLVLNGVYQGNYQISDQMEVRKKRVDITEQEEVLTDESDISGGYFLEVDGFATSEPVYIRTNRGVLITIKSPDDEVIVQRQINYIKGYIQQFEDALFADYFTDPKTGYRQYVDSLTLASWYISTELSGNVDGFWSTYIYKEQGDPKIYWGPLWDYDIAYNNCDRVGDVSRKLMIDAGYGQDLTGLWVKRMWRDPWFCKLISRTWNELAERGFKEHVLHKVDSLAALVEQSQQKNFQKWPINQHVYNEIVLFDTYKEGVDYLKSFIDTHFDYLTEAFHYEEPTPKFVCNEDYYYTILNKGCMRSLAVLDSKLCLWEKLAERESQQWDIVPTGKYYQIVNRESGLALSDNAAVSGSSYAVGTQLVLQESNEFDFRQQWSFVPVGTGRTYVIVNRKTGLALNNQSGADTNGNPVISWTNDEHNAEKPTRQWVLSAETPKTNPDGVTVPSADQVQYAVVYNAGQQQIRFVPKGDAVPEGRAVICNAGGMQCMQFTLDAAADVSSLPKGAYVLQWTEGGRTRSVKFVK